MATFPEEKNTVDAGENLPDPTPCNDGGLPKNFDVMIVGTGLTESIVSAAVSRNGHTVLHIDPRDYYGGSWATFALDQWTSSNFFEVPREALEDVKVSAGDYNGSVKWQSNVQSFEQVWYNQDEEVKTELMKQKRRFNIDVMPKLIAAREDIVQLLITSNVSRYLEFLRISKLLTNLPSPKDEVIEAIPLSRADIFTSKSLTLVEKRSLVKLIEAVMKQPQKEEKTESTDHNATEESKEPIPETFEELVQITKVSDKLQHMVKSSITVLEDDLSPDLFNQEFCGRCRLLLNSIGRYGNQTPYLWTLYGISEICQAFCRLSAVYGGIFILKRHLSKIVSTQEGYVVTTDKDEITAKNVIFGPDLNCDIIGQEKSRKERSIIYIGRAVLITKGGNIKTFDETTKARGDGIFVYRISGVELIEMNHTSQAVPKDYRLLQVSYPITDSSDNGTNVRQVIEEKLKPFLDFQCSSVPEENSTMPPDDVVTSQSPESGKHVNSKPQVIYGSYFILNYNCDSVSSELFRNNGSSAIMESAIASSDISKYVKKAESIFASMYPDEEFLPKAPDCEDAEEINGNSNDNDDSIDELVDDNGNNSSNENTGASNTE